MTARTEHTPGPWAVGPGMVSYQIYADGGNGERVATASRDIGPESEFDANARLIASAPALLAACEQAAEHFRDTDAPLGDMLRAAIAQARGEK